MKSIYQINVTLIIMLTFLFSPLLISQTGTIPWIPVSKDAPDNIPNRNASAPTFSEIGIPVYPGAYLTSVYPVSKSSNSDSIDLPLPTIVLVTSDDQETVKRFYKERLKESDGWKSFENYSTFVKGDLSEALSRTVPGVGVREETGESYDLYGADPKIVSSLKTRIKILYKP